MLLKGRRNPPAPIFSPFDSFIRETTHEPGDQLRYRHEEPPPRRRPDRRRTPRRHGADRHHRRYLAPLRPDRDALAEPCPVRGLCRPRRHGHAGGDQRRGEVLQRRRQRHGRRRRPGRSRLRRSSRGQPVPPVLPAVPRPPQGSALPCSRAPSLRHGPGLRLHRLRRRLRGHQQPRRQERRRGDGDPAGRQGIQGRSRRHRSQDRSRAPQDQGRLELRLRQVRHQGSPRRRLGRGGRQSVRPRRQRDDRHRVGPRPRHRLRSL